MALLIDTTHKGIPVTGAYVTVVMPTVSTDKATVSFGVWYSADRDHEHFHADTKKAPYSIDSGDPFKQAYDHLKTLQEFELAEDC